MIPFRRLVVFLPIAGLVIFKACITLSSKPDVILEPGDYLPRLISPAQTTMTDRWQAIKRIEWDFDRHFSETSLEINRLASILERLRNGQYENAIADLEVFYKTVSDSAIRQFTGELLCRQYFLLSRWSAIDSIPDSSDRHIDDEIQVLARGYSSLPAEEYHFPANAVVLPITLSIAGVPVVEVEINGQKRHFWFDTGASISVIASDIIKELGIRPMPDHKVMVGTSTSHKVGLNPTLIDELRIGDLIVRHHPAAVIDHRDLEFRVLGVIKLVKIDGIIGWNLIQNLAVELDYGAKTITICQPQMTGYPWRNFFFLEIPTVVLMDSANNRHSFFLDTGANRSSITSTFIEKTALTPVRTGHALVGGAGGFEKIQSQTVSNVILYLDQVALSFAMLTTHPEDSERLFLYSGVIGSDVARNGVMILDFQNGYFGIRPGIAEIK